MFVSIMAIMIIEIFAFELANETIIRILHIHRNEYIFIIVFVITIVFMVYMMNKIFQIANSVATYFTNSLSHI